MFQKVSCDWRKRWNVCCFVFGLCMKREILGCLLGIFMWQNMYWILPKLIRETCSVLGLNFGFISGNVSGVILCRVWMSVIGMSETLCCGFHLGVIKRRSHMRWYMTIGEVNTLRLWSRYAVMLCRGESFGIPLLTRCVAIRCAERMWLGLGFS